MFSDVYLHSRVNHMVLDWYRPGPTLPLLEIVISGLEGDSRFILDCLDTFEIIWINGSKIYGRCKSRIAELTLAE